MAELISAVLAVEGNFVRDQKSVQGFRYNKIVSDELNKDLEKEKLQLEIDELKKPAIRKPGTWFNVFAALAATAGIVGQGILSNIKVERALFDAEQKTVAANIRVAAATGERADAPDRRSGPARSVRLD